MAQRWPIVVFLEKQDHLPDMAKRPQNDNPEKDLAPPRVLPLGVPLGAKVVVEAQDWLCARLRDAGFKQNFVKWYTSNEDDLYMRNGAWNEAKRRFNKICDDVATAAAQL